MPYTDQQEYAKHLKKKCQEQEGSGCEGCNEGCADNDCTCCPPGLVAVYDDQGKHIACLTPNDAELYKSSNFSCQDGYVVLVQTVGGKNFFSCISEDKFQDIYSTLNP